MLTRKEINGLKFIFKKLKGQHEEYVALKELLKNRYNLSDKDSFELAYLYDNNFVEDGNFESVDDPNRMSYDQYMDLPSEILALMEYTNDRDPEKYEVKNSWSSSEEIEYEGTTYYIYNNWKAVESRAYDQLDYLCDDPDEHLESYLYMTDTDKRIIAQDEADSFFDNLSDEDVIEMADIEDKIDEIKENAEKIESLREKIDELDEKFGELQGELDDAEDEEEKIRIQKEMDEINTEMNELQNEYDSLEEVENVDDEIQTLIDENREQLKSDKYDEIYDELETDFVSYFIDNGYYNNIRELIRNGPVDFDCGDVKSDYLEGTDYDDVASILGYEWVEDVSLGGDTYYIFSEQ